MLTTTSPNVIIQYSSPYQPPRTRAAAAAVKVVAAAVSAVGRVRRVISVRTVAAARTARTWPSLVALTSYGRSAKKDSATTL